MTVMSRCCTEARSVMIAEVGLVLLAFFAGIYWKGREHSSLSAGKRCYVCGKSIGTESSVTDHKRRIFYHFGCWTKVVKHDVFSPDDGTLDV